MNQGQMQKHTKLCSVTAHDGNTLDVKIDYPQNCKSVVVCCHGSGANTYDNRREIQGMQFCYYDLFADELCKRNIGFCRWNTRGCTQSDRPPGFVQVDAEAFETYLPSTSIQDVLTVKAFVKTLPQFRQSHILFMGVSEGATLMPFAAARCEDVQGLLLLGFAYENLKNTLDWQLGGGSSMVNMCRYFDCREKGYVEKEDFVEDKYHVRKDLFGDTAFEALDIDRDGKLTRHDFALRLAEYKHELFRAIEDNDDRWLRDHYGVLITSKWCKEHFALPEVSAVMSSLTMPICIFHGEDDGNIPVSDAEKIRRDFEKAGKENLQIFTFPRHDHDLNYLQYVFDGRISEGLSCVFDMAQILSEGMPAGTSVSYNCEKPRL